MALSNLMESSWVVGWIISLGSEHYWKWFYLLEFCFCFFCYHCSFHVLKNIACCSADTLSAHPFKIIDFCLLIIWHVCWLLNLIFLNPIFVSIDSCGLQMLLFFPPVTLYTWYWFFADFKLHLLFTFDSNSFLVFSNCSSWSILFVSSFPILFFLMPN